MKSKKYYIRFYLINYLKYNEVISSVLYINTKQYSKDSLKTIVPRIMASWLSKSIPLLSALLAVLLVAQQVLWAEENDQYSGKSGE